jgi:hypothetical protein
MLIDPDAFERCFLAWVRAVFRCDAISMPEQIAVDGKTVRRSFDRRRGRSPLHLVSAYATERGVVLAQRATPDQRGLSRLTSQSSKGSSHRNFCCQAKRSARNGSIGAQSDRPRRHQRCATAVQMWIALVRSAAWGFGTALLYHLLRRWSPTRHKPRFA